MAKPSGKKKSPAKSTPPAPAPRATPKPSASPAPPAKATAAPATPTTPPASAPASAASKSSSTPPVSKPPAPTAPPTPAKRTPSPAKTAAQAPVPPTPAPLILAEGDEQAPPPVGGPGQRFALGPVPVAPASGNPAPSRSLPAAYGTGKLLLVARDPRWLYAHWDLTDAQLADYNRRSALGHLVVRVFDGTTAGRLLIEQEVHPESRNWFLHVPKPGAAYQAELGFPDRSGTWQRIAQSAATVTPADELSADTWVRFETVPFVARSEQVIALVKEAAGGHPGLSEAVRAAGAAAGWTGHTDSVPPDRAPSAGGPGPGSVGAAPAFPPGDASSWTPEQERALAELVRVDEARRVWIGSLEITELLRRQLIRGISSAEHLPSLPAPGETQAGIPSGIFSVSSPFGGGASSGRGFRFEVNAELIIYGATEPDATVTIGDRTIRLRPDGSFAFRFSLPDGEFPLPVVAVAADGHDRRAAQLRFRRDTSHVGHVGVHPQDPALRPPTPDHVS